MSHVILGLLMIVPMSLYDLVRAFESGIALFYSASTGSIKRALDRLLAEGHIEVESAEPGPRGRKVYRVTDTGREEFHAWMSRPLAGGSLETEALSRLHFLGHLEPTDRIDVLENIEHRITEELAALEAVERQVEASDVPPGLEDLARYQRASLDYGLSSTRHGLEWFRDLIRREHS